MAAGAQCEVFVGIFGTFNDSITATTAVGVVSRLTVTYTRAGTSTADDTVDITAASVVVDINATTTTTTTATAEEDSSEDTPPATEPPPQISRTQVSSVVQQAGESQFGILNPLGGPQLRVGAGGNPTPTEPEEGDEQALDPALADPTGALNGIFLGLARFYDAPITDGARMAGLSDTSYEFHHRDGLATDPIRRFDERSRGSGFGAAGDAYTAFPIGAADGLRVWGYGAFDTFRNDRLKADATGVVTDDLRQEGDSFAVNIGSDYRISQDLLVGVSLGFSRSDVDLTFNGGSYRENLFTVAPYLAQEFFDDRLSVGVTAGYGMGLAEIATAANGRDDEAGTSLIFTALNVTGGDYLFGTDFSAEGSFDYAFVRKEIDGFSSSDGARNPVTTANSHDLTFGGEIRYDLAVEWVTIQPFAAADLVWQLQDTINNDPVFGNIGGGVRLLGGETGFAGQFEAIRTVDRSDLTRTQVRGSLSYTFALGLRDRTRVSPFVETAVDPGTFGLRTGVDLTSHNDAIGASLSVSQHRPRALSDAAANTAVRLDAEIRF